MPKGHKFELIVEKLVGSGIAVQNFRTFVLSVISHSKRRENVHFRKNHLSGRFQCTKGLLNVVVTV